ncbi:MAG TPA: efflux transporter outer membrane subunit [Cyclobacteriaceae bacterium]|nr:efflux transporter outer membrane subunit [Cyclobacteriaceae bacterium]
MKKNSIYKFSYLPVLLLSLQSCFVAKDYARPDVVQETDYRTNLVAKDSSTMAELSWREIFTDPILQDYIANGLENNVDARIALQQVEAANAYYLQGKAAYFPSLNGSGQVTHQALSKNSQFGALFDGTLTQYELTGSLSWEADIWGKIRSNRRASEASYLQSLSAQQAIKTRLIASIASVYYQLVAFDEQKKITEETIATREFSLETMKALKEAGTVNEVGVKQTEAQLHTARAMLIDIDMNSKLLENTLSILLGGAPRAIERSSLDDQAIFVDIEVGYPAQLLRNRPDVMAAEYGLVNAFELTNVAKSNFYPSLGISATGGFQSLELDKLLSVNSLFATTVGSLTQPIFNQRRIRTQYEVAQAQQEIAYLNFRQSLLDASKEVSDALYSYEAAGKKIAVKTEEFQAYDIAAEYSEELLNNGFANYLEVLTARENALRSELDLINARYSRLNSAIELYRALGGGWQ